MQMKPAPQFKKDLTGYESPLLTLKRFRYHPRFLRLVEGGYLSLTFSHQIDPVRPLCPDELSLGACSDSNCTFQHFRGLRMDGSYSFSACYHLAHAHFPSHFRSNFWDQELTAGCANSIGDRVILQLGWNGSSGEDGPYKESLRVLLTDLRAQETSGFDQVTQAVVDHRLKFFGSWL